VAAPERKLASRLASLGARLLIGPAGLVATATATDLLNRFARVGIAVRVGRQVDDPEIDTEPILGLDRGILIKQIVHRSESLSRLFWDYLVLQARARYHRAEDNDFVKSSRSRTLSARPDDD
jgi:hypothetical protein